jgi:hypothetical protein
MTRQTIPLLLVMGATLMGCGLHDPYSQKPQKGPATSHGTAAQMRPSPQESLPRGSDATGIVARYATIWVNWSATTLPRERAELLALATGPLADELRREIAQAVKTQLREVSQSYSHGKYIGAIALHGGRVIVVTYEEVAPLGGQAHASYHVYLARTEHTAQGWKLNEWQPATDS